MRILRDSDAPQNGETLPWVSINDNDQDTRQ
jgi:hypothetical protein